MTQNIARKCRRATVAEAMKKRCAYDHKFVKLVKALKAKAKSANAKEVVKQYVTYEIKQQIKCHARMIGREPAQETDRACFACLSFVATSKSASVASTSCVRGARGTVTDCRLGA